MGERRSRQSRGSAKLSSQSTACLMCGSSSAPNGGMSGRIVREAFKCGARRVVEAGVRRCLGDGSRSRGNRTGTASGLARMLRCAMSAVRPPSTFRSRGRRTWCVLFPRSGESGANVRSPRTRERTYPAPANRGTRIEEGDRLRTDSTRRRRGGPERRTDWEHNCCRNAYVNRMWRRKIRWNNGLVISTTFVSSICYRPLDAVPCRDIASSTGTPQRALALGLVRLHLSSATSRLPPERVDNSSSGDRAALAADGEADRIGRQIGRICDRSISTG